MSNLKTRVQIKNKYELEVYDASGKLKDKAYAYNVVTDRFWRHFFGEIYGDNLYWFRYISIGTGTGTPSTSDTSFFKYLAYATGELVSFEKAYPTSTMVCKATFPASTSIVGTITEVGFNHGPSHYNSCLTHALLQDAEGNTITIEKTDTDILIVTATLYITITAVDGLELVPVESNDILNAIRNSVYRGPYILDTLYLAACPLFPNYSYIAYKSLHTAAGSVASRSMTLGTTRLASTEGNRNGVGTFVNSIFVSDIGKIRLPNADFFPVYALQPMAVGAGDGTTTEFACPIPEFIEGTDVVKVDGVTMTRGVDYTVDPVGNTALNASATGAKSNFAKSISNGGKASSAGSSHVLGIASTGGIAALGAFTKDAAPLVFDMGEEVDCNTLFIDGLVFRYNLNGSYAATVVLEYSNDNAVWTEAGRDTLEAWGYTYSEKIPASSRNRSIKFGTVKARYWRIYIESTSSYVNNYGVGSAWGNSFIGYVGEGIKFTTPPAKDAVITIAASVDRPYKTADYVLDYSATLYF